MNTKPIYKIMLLIFSALLWISACSGLPSQATPTPEPQPDLEVQPLVSATGVVRPAQWTKLSMSTVGIVEEILVKEGDSVTAGQSLVRLKGKEDLQAAIAAARFEVTAAQKALDDLNENAETASLQAQQAISMYSKQVRDAKYQLDNYIVAANQVGLEPVEAMDLMRAQLETATQAFEPYKFKSQNDPIRKELKRQLDNAQSDYNAAVRRLELVNELQVAEANLAKAREDYATWQNGPDPADVTVAEARLQNANAALAAAEAALNDLELRALFDGVVSELYIRAGEWVIPGQSILQLADLGHLQVETTDLNEIDAARVQLGDSVIVTFDALPDVSINGLVKSIAPKAAEGSGVNYTVVVELSEWPAALRWGMTAFVDIAVE